VTPAQTLIRCSELAKERCGCAIIRVCRILFVRKYAEIGHVSMFLYLGIPFVQLWFERNAFESASFRSSQSSAVKVILTLCRWAQIGSPIVQAVAVTMIYLLAVARRENESVHGNMLLKPIDSRQARACVPSAFIPDGVPIVLRYERPIFIVNDGNFSFCKRNFHLRII
jgi:hypothetical protein